LLRIGREQLSPYEVRIQEETVTHVAKRAGHFEVTTASGRRHSRKLLLATGIADQIPDIEGLDPLYGRSVFTCPLCDGWEVRGRGLAVYGQASAAVEIALALTNWSEDLLLCTGGTTGFTEREVQELSAHGITVRSDSIARLEGEDGQLRRIVFARGDSVRRDALFLCVGTRPRSPLVEQFDCNVDLHGKVETRGSEQTAVPGLYVVGDASEDVNFIAIAVAEGTRAACAAHRALREEDSRARLALFQDRAPDLHGH